jgi:hypothetical protein
MFDRTTAFRNSAANAGCPEVAGQRPGRVADRRAGLDLRLLRHFERVVDFDTQIPYGAFELAMPRQDLDGAQPDPRDQSFRACSVTSNCTGRCVFCCMTKSSTCCRWPD